MSIPCAASGIQRNLGTTSVRTMATKYSFTNLNNRYKHATPTVNERYSFFLYIVLEVFCFFFALLMSYEHYILPGICSSSLLHKTVPVYGVI